MPPPERRSTQVKDATSAIRARHRAQRRRRAIRVGIGVGVVAILGATVWAIWFSPWFVAREIEVSGLHQINEDEILAAAQIEFGTHLVSLDTDAIAQRVRALPIVADVAITRTWSGVVRIAVTERTAVYGIPWLGEYVLVDAQGIGFLTAPYTPEGLLIINLNADDSPTSTRLMADAATIAVALPDSVRSQLSWMTAQTPDTFTIGLLNGSQILWGSAEQSELKAQVIDGLLKISASYYDISSPSHPSTR